jgi:hypothetical protein
VRSWANLHEFLASILAKTLECNKAIAFGMWHSIKSDLAQREMLAAALKTKIRLLANEGEKAKRLGKPEISTQKYDEAKLFSEYLWAVNEITSFSHKRNDLIHSPIVFFHGGLDATTATEFEAIVSDMHGNPRAAKYKDKELFQICGWANAFLQAAKKFIALLGHTRPAGAPLPGRPQWPSVSKFPTRRQQPHQKTKRRLQRPHLSSRA